MQIYDTILMLPHLSYLDRIEKAIIHCESPKLYVVAICDANACRIEVSVCDMHTNYIHPIARSVAIPPYYVNWERVKEQAHNLFQILSRLYEYVESEEIVTIVD